MPFEFQDYPRNIGTSNICPKRLKKPFALLQDDLSQVPSNSSFLVFRIRGDIRNLLDLVPVHYL